MISRERVLASIAHQKPDRVPLNIWMYREDVQKKVIQKYGNLDNFFDSLHVDMFTAWTHEPRKDNFKDKIYNATQLLDVPFRDPNEQEIYKRINLGLMPAGVKEVVSHHKEEKGRAVFVQIVGPYESAQSFLGTENTLLEMALHKEEMKLFFRRSCLWWAQVAENCIDLGVDVIHISDDWGQNKVLLFSPRDWWDMIYPNVRIIVDTAKKRKVPVSLHSDGYIDDVVDGVLRLGINVLHPVQESAGMDQLKLKQEYGDRLTIYGGLDITELLPKGTEEEIKKAVRSKMLNLKPNGGFIFCSSHTIQPDTTLERVNLAYQIAFKESWY